MMLLLIFYVHLPLNPCPIDVHTPLSRMLPLASQANCANLFKLKLHTNAQTVRQSGRTTFNCFHCAQLGGKQATGTTATPSSHLKSCTLVVHTICSIHLKLSRGTCNAPLCNGQCSAQLLTHNYEICEICENLQTAILE